MAAWASAVDPLSDRPRIGETGVIVPSHKGPNGDTTEMLKTDTRQANWRRANPGKYEAHLAVQRAVKAGELDKQSCEVCGVEAVDAHHDQYDEPLCVRWLCRRHHTRLHHYGEDMFPVRNSSAPGAGAD
jgi:hypothetical protein